MLIILVSAPVRRNHLGLEVKVFRVVIVLRFDNLHTSVVLVNFHIDAMWLITR